MLKAKLYDKILLLNFNRHMQYVFVYMIFMYSNKHIDLWTNFKSFWN